MARIKNDGRGRLGGRRKGTPNKVTGSLKEWLTDLINKNRGNIENDLLSLEPLDRLKMIDKLLSYVIPRQAATTAKIDFNDLSDEQLIKLTEELTKGVKDYES